MYSIKLYLKQRGYSLLELLIGLGVGVFLLAGGVLIYTHIMKSFYDLLNVIQLDQQLRSAMEVMVTEIRRAGYSANSVNDINSGVNTNPFMASGADIISPSSTCILFTYDYDSSGLLPSLNATNYDKRFGYRLTGNTLQARALTDSVFNCASGNWIDITDTNLVNISNLTFTLTPTVITLDNGVSTLTMRNATISLTGSLINDASVTRTIVENVRVRNDKYTP